MHPVFIEIFGRPIYWYGVFTALGFLAAVANWAWLGRRDDRPPGLASELGIWIMVCGILGARVAYVLANLEIYQGNLLELVRIDRGGLVYYGGFLGATLGVMVLARLRGQPLWSFGDYVITSVPLGHGLGRMGCFLNGCCFGTPSELPWAVFVENQHRHPTPLYETLFNFGLFIALHAVYRRRSHDGVVVAAYLLLYPLGRFFLEFIRGDPRMEWLHLSVAQNLSILLFVLGILLLTWRIRQSTPGHALPVHRP
jgi:phosphatidylglycerol:prolipoprotein diacylglycerol transferase